VEYVDALGRTRTCLKQDLPKLERMDRKLGSGSSTADVSFINSSLVQKESFSVENMSKILSTV